MVFIIIDLLFFDLFSGLHSALADAAVGIAPSPPVQTLMLML
jgi:hypothetical protein